MNKIKIIDIPFKSPKKNKFTRRKTLEYKNNIEIDADISDMDKKISKYQLFKKENAFNISNNERNDLNKPITSNKKIYFGMPKFKRCNSFSTSTSYAEKGVKKVTFSTIEIIRIDNYKKYNEACNFSKDQIKKTIKELKHNKSGKMCIVF